MVPAQRLRESGETARESRRDDSVARRRAVGEAVWLLVIPALALIVTLGGLSARTGLEKISGPGEMVRKTAHRPYVYRQLAPSVIRAVQAARPQASWERLEERMVSSGFVAGFATWTGFRYKWWRQRDLAEIFLSAGLNWLCLIAFAFALRGLLRSQIDGSRLFFNLTSALGLYGLLFLTREGVYIYDYPQLLLFTLGLLLLATRRWALFYPVYLAAALSKETSVLLSLAFVAACWQEMPRKRLLLHLAGQAALFLPVRLGLQLAFRDNPGAPLEGHFLDHNVRLLLDPPPLAEMTALAIALFLLVHRWSDKPLFLRQATVIFWPLAGMAMLFGFFDELRDYYEVYPLFLGLTAMSATWLLGGGVGARAPSAQQPGEGGDR